MIGNFYAGVGFSGRQLRQSDTIARSYESAVVAIVSQISTTVRTRDTSTGSSSQSMTQRSRGNLSNFTVLEIWIDPDTRAVSTLAVARNADEP